MAEVKEKKRGRGRPKGSTNKKKAEAKEKVTKLLEGIPLHKETPKVIEKKPEPKDHDSEWVLEQLDVANLKIKELEEQIAHYKASYDKLNTKGGSVGDDGVNPQIKERITKMYNEMIYYYNKQRKQGVEYPSMIMNYTGSGPQGLLQQLSEIFPFLQK